MTEAFGDAAPPHPRSSEKCSQRPSRHATGMVAIVVSFSADESARVRSSLHGKSSLEDSAQPVGEERWDH